MKTVKPKVLIMAFSMLSLCLGSCSLVDLDAAPFEQVESPIGIPVSEAAFRSVLTNDDSRQWHARSFSLEGLNGVQQCRLDDTFTFFSDGTYRYDGGETLCGGADDRRVKTGIWEIDFSNLRLIFDRGTSLESVARLSGLQDNRMELAGQVDVFGQTLQVQGIYEFNIQ